MKKSSYSLAVNSYRQVCILGRRLHLVLGAPSINKLLSYTSPYFSVTSPMSTTTYT